MPDSKYPTKSEMFRMLAEAVRNTQPKPITPPEAVRDAQPQKRPAGRPSSKRVAKTKKANASNKRRKKRAR